MTTIHHGIDTDAFALGKGGGGYLLFFGRIHPHKGAAEAIRADIAALYDLREGLQAAVDAVRGAFRERT